MRLSWGTSFSLKYAKFNFNSKLLLVGNVRYRVWMVVRESSAFMRVVFVVLTIDHLLSYTLCQQHNMNKKEIYIRLKKIIM